MKRAFLITAALLLVAALAGFVLMPRGEPARADLQPAAPSLRVPAPELHLANDPSPSPLADALNSPSTDIHSDLRIVSEIIDAFRTNFPRAGNPVGDNREITAALTGNNRLRLALIPADHPAINRAGELCDRWGSPFFFHAESATKMEIRSAGPDRRMWNADDVVFRP